MKGLKSQHSNLEERLYLILTGIFIASLVSCNLIFQKFFQIDIWIPFIGWYTFTQSVGLLPYPVTFLVTDIISEIYGKKRADQVVISGLIASIFMLAIVSVADYMQAANFGIDKDTFHKVFGLSGAAVFASMMAYLFAQFIDVRLFHFWKQLTKGKHLWLRNNASTIFSQMIDTFSVLFLLCYFNVIPWDMLGILFINGFLFKVFFAAFDTPLFYIISYVLRKKFGLQLGEEVN
tara:strand:- start:616 stop:1317 length:702 start_codon:yes stop_codon:yes gene_type:complete